MKLFFLGLFFFSSFHKAHAAISKDCDTCFISYKEFKGMSNDSIVKKFSDNDTATTIINYFFIKKKRHLRGFAILGGATLVGTGTSAILADLEAKRNPGFFSGIEYAIIGVGIFVVGIIATAVEGLNANSYSKSTLYKELKYFYENKKLSKKLARKNIFDGRYTMIKK